MLHKLRFIVSVTLGATGLSGAAPAGDLWIAGNSVMEVAINRTTGRIDRLKDKVSGEDFCNESLRRATAETDGNTGGDFDSGTRYAGLILIDELRQREFSDLVDHGRVTLLREDAASISFDKQYRGAEFVVTETFRVLDDHLRWDIRIRKTSGKDRTVRVIQFAPLPLGQYEAWAPIADAPIAIKPWLPFSIDYGQSTSGAVGEGRWRTCIPLMVFYSTRNKRAISFTSPFEVPAVRIRFLTNTGAGADFHWNSRQYPLRERPLFLVSNEYLGVRAKRPLETGLLISMHPADWRPALGWVYSKYKSYFDGDPSFDRWDGALSSGEAMMHDSLTPEHIKKEYAARYEHGIRWEELHNHFPWYGKMIPDATVKSWHNESHPVMKDFTMTRAKIAEHCRVAKAGGVGTFVYYNVTESEHWYATEKFPASVAKSESGRPIGAFHSQSFPDKRACWLMNADAATDFGKYMIAQAREMVDAYPEAAGFFWDVYGRSYMFDFAHDDGITMVNNKPVYYPEFMYQRLMRDHIRPLLRSRGMLITANKPVTIASCKGLDGIMAMENAPREDSPAWITAQSYLGLNRHIMILDLNATNVEMMYLHCLRYGMFDTDLMISEASRSGGPVTEEMLRHNGELRAAYRPVIDQFRGRKWIFYPRALELPKNTEGNIFRLEDGSVMITMVSAWRHLRAAPGSNPNLEVICRLPDAAQMKSVEVNAVDLGEKTKVEPKREGDTLRIIVPKHGKATVIMLRP